MGQDPDAIRREIEQTRERMGDTVEAIGYKADVPARTKERVSDTFSDVKDRIGGTANTVVDRIGGTATAVGESTPDAADIKQAARRGASIAQENPIGLAVGSIAVGFLAGMLIPATRVEDEKLGEVSDSVIEKVKETGQEALEHGKQVAQEAAQSAQETVKESGQEHAQQVKESAQQSAQDAASSSGSPQMSTYQTH